MKREAAEILKDALAVPTEARAGLAGSLLESLNTGVDKDAEAAWATEVNRRIAELDSGAVKTIPWAEVRQRLTARSATFASNSIPLGVGEAEAIFAAI
jgi:putative addiction module component (TIGR02574 family)